ncbi:MAG: HlyD family efflux transporter periplasmic adaptor subunit [Proteobacteria bacterium]|nr:HlyD family efflux transporter periplasmic adaptor subunit [Pseudomonadota bacterium]
MKFDHLPLPILKTIIFPKISRNIAIMLVTAIIFTTLILSFTPWRQTSKGVGRVIALDVNNRIQKLIAPVSGKISKWHVIDGQFVEKGQVIFEIADNDPYIITRLENERQAAKQQYEAALDAAKTAKINQERQEELWKQGLSSRKDYEKARIEHQKAEGYSNELKAKLEQVSVKLGRQQSQSVKALQDGFVTDIEYFANSSFVKAGEVLGQFVPLVKDPAVSIYIHGIDVPLIYAGRKVRVRFEGWPVFQFSGWPDAAIGTFGGVVKFISNASSDNGKFKVIIVPDPDDQPWPSQEYMKYGMRAEGWILLGEVRLGYEIWRKLNGFPPSIDNDIIHNKLAK